MCVATFKQYFSYIVAVSLVEETGIIRESHRPPTIHWQILSFNVVSNTPLHEQDETHNINGDRHWLHINFPPELTVKKV